MSSVILKLVRNWRMVIACCIGHTDLAFDKKVGIFKRGGNWAVIETSLRVELVKGLHGRFPVRKTIIIAHE